jgi:hypothetical protein
MLASIRRHRSLIFFCRCSKKYKAIGNLGLQNNHETSPNLGNGHEREHFRNGYVGQTPNHSSILSISQLAICMDTSLPLRVGTWGHAELEYTAKLKIAFDAGVLPLPGGKRFTEFMSYVLHCEPTRASRKFLQILFEPNSIPLPPTTAGIVFTELLR